MRTVSAQSRYDVRVWCARGQIAARCSVCRRCSDRAIRAVGRPRIALSGVSQAPHRGRDPFAAMLAYSPLRRGPAIFRLCRQHVRSASAAEPNLQVVSGWGNGGKERGPLMSAQAGSTGTRSHRSWDSSASWSVAEAGSVGGGGRCRRTPRTPKRSDVSFPAPLRLRVYRGIYAPRLWRSTLIAPGLRLSEKRDEDGQRVRIEVTIVRPDRPTDPPTPRPTDPPTPRPTDLDF
jgi:hypothetical protein